MGGPILPPVADTLKLRPGAPTVGKLDQAGLRLVDLQRVVQAGTPRAHVGQAEPDVTNLALDGQIELMDAPIPRLEGEAFDALRRNLGKSQVGGKRIGESKKRLSVLDAIDIGLREPERSARRVHERKQRRVRRRFGKDPVGSAHHRFVRDPISCAQTRHEVLLRGMGNWVTCRHRDAAGVERTDLV